LGGVVAPKGSAYIMPSMANPNAERPRKPLNAQIPSQTDLGGVGNMKPFNPYNTLGTYKNGVNTMINTQELPRTYGGGFYTNVNLENPTGSPIVPRIDMNKVAQIRDLQRRFPYNKENMHKKWWKCGAKCGGGIGGCVGRACVGPGGITIKF
jgi:hypothetical protein